VAGDSNEEEEDERVEEERGERVSFEFIACDPVCVDDEWKWN
jgi:hypothetical protein